MSAGKTQVSLHMVLLTAVFKSKQESKPVLADDLTVGSGDSLSDFADDRNYITPNCTRQVNWAPSIPEHNVTAYQSLGDIYYRAHYDLHASLPDTIDQYQNQAENDSFTEKEEPIAINCQRSDVSKPDKQLCTEPVFPCQLFSSDFVQFRRLKIPLSSNRGQKYGGPLAQDASRGRPSDSDQKKMHVSHVTFTTGRGLNTNRFVTVWEVSGDTQIGSLPYNGLEHFANKVACNSHKNVLKCKNFGKSHAQADALKRHQSIETRGKSYQSREAFTLSQTLKTQQIVHTGDKHHQCTGCGTSFRRSEYIMRHQRIHTGDKPYQCSFCGKAFDMPYMFKTHLHIHTGEKPYQCTDCGKYFYELESLQIHQRIHTGYKPYKCTDCSKFFLRPYALKIHRRIHTGEKPYQCKDCDKAFSQLASLKRHQHIHTWGKSYQCASCGKTFRDAGYLNKHQRLHTGDKPYLCAVCGKTFTQSDHLKTHQRIHTGDKPYKCTYCSKFFRRSDALNKHRRIHTGDKPYQCTECSKAFNQLGSLKKHKLIHTRKALLSITTLENTSTCLHDVKHTLPGLLERQEK